MSTSRIDQIAARHTTGVTDKIGESAAERFRHDGYFVVERCVEPAALAALREAADRAVAEEEARLRSDEARFVPVSSLDDRYVVSGFVKRDPRVREFLLGSLMAEVCRASLGPNAYLFSDTFVCKAPNNEHGWIWHQDSSYLDYVGCGHYLPNLSVWIALDDMTIDNGSLRVIPFSVLDVRKVVAHDLSLAWTSDDVVKFDNHENNRLLVIPAGSLVALDGALPHASDRNRSPAPRRAYLVQYSRTPVEKDGKPIQLAIPLLIDGIHQAPRGHAPAAG